jgi:hypothetical protein
VGLELRIQAATRAANDKAPPASVPWGVVSPSVAERWPELVAPRLALEPLSLGAMREVLREGDRVSDSWERMLAHVARRSGVVLALRLRGLE